MVTKLPRSWLKQIVGEEEFNRWYAKWTVLDWLRQLIAVLIVSSAGIVLSYIKHLSVAWESGFVGALIACLFIFVPVVFSRVRGRRRSLASPGLLPSVELRFSQAPPYVHVVQHRTVYRIGLFNGGEEAIYNLQVSLCQIDPVPRGMIYRADFPYRVTRVTGLDALDLQGCIINPKDEVLFEIAQSWVTGPPDNRLIVNRIDTKRPNDSYLEIHRDERWSLRYRVSGANCLPHAFALAMAPRGETLSVYLENGNPTESL